MLRIGSKVNIRARNGLARRPYATAGSVGRAAKTKNDAIRMIGRELAKMEKAKAGRPPENQSRNGTDFRGAPTLADLGFENRNRHSNDFQTLDDKAFEMSRRRDKLSFRTIANSPTSLAPRSPSAAIIGPPQPLGDQVPDAPR